VPGERGEVIRTAYNIRYLEMRKLRPTHRKGASSSVKAVRQSPSLSFDSFLFVDNITNSRIMLKDARRHY
jgi:hypothetical protein